MRLFAALTVVLAACAVAGSARADGDPASDYLIAQSVFLPFDTKVDKSSADELRGLLTASKQAGYEVRVAVISSKVDLGAVPVLYKAPQQYARFLGQELFYWYKHDLLVVMPNGYGVSRNGKLEADGGAVVAKLPPPNTTDGTALVDAAIRAVQALDRKHGVHVAPVVVHSSSNNDRWIIAGAAGAAALVATAILLWRRRR